MMWGHAWRLLLAVWLGGALVLFLAAGQGWASCAGRVVGGPPLVADYDPFAPADLRLPGRVAIENDGTAPCAFRLGVEPVPGAAGGGQAPRFEIRGAAGEMLAATGLDPKAASAAVSRTVAPGESVEFRYELRLPAGQMLPPGRHELAFELALGEAALGESHDAAGAFDRATLAVSVRVEDRIGVNIAGAGLAKTIDFGELRQGDSRRVLIAARGNRNFILEATSRNGGVLAMDTPHQQWRIPYAVTLGGVRIGLPARLGPYAPTTIAGHQLEAVFTIGDVSAKRAGLYTDEVVIEIRPAL